MIPTVYDSEERSCSYEPSTKVYDRTMIYNPNPISSDESSDCSSDEDETGITSTKFTTNTAIQKPNYLIGNKKSVHADLQSARYIKK